MNYITQLKTALAKEDVYPRPVSRLLEIQDTRLFHMKQWLDKQPHGWQRQLLQGAIVDLEELVDRVEEIKDENTALVGDNLDLTKDLDELKANYATLLDERNNLRAALEILKGNYGTLMSKADSFEGALEKIREVCDEHI